MAMEKWIVTYEVKKVNGQPYNKRQELIESHAPGIPRIIQRAAETLQDKYDFGFVRATATSVEDSTRKFSFIAQAEAGLRDSWTP